MQDTNIFMLMGSSLVTILILGIVLKVIFEVNRHLRYQQKQLDVLVKVAEKLGVDPLELSEMVNSK